MSPLVPLLAGDFAAAFSPYGVLNTLIQWGGALVVFWLANDWMARRTEAHGGPHPDLGRPPASIP